MVAVGVKRHKQAEAASVNDTRPSLQPPPPVLMPPPPVPNSSFTSAPTCDFPVVATVINKTNVVAVAMINQDDNWSCYETHDVEKYIVLQC